MSKSVAYGHCRRLDAARYNSVNVIIRGSIKRERLKGPLRDVNPLCTAVAAGRWHGAIACSSIQYLSADAAEVGFSVRRTVYTVVDLAGTQ